MKILRYYYALPICSYRVVTKSADIPRCEASSAESDENTCSKVGIETLLLTFGVEISGSSIIVFVDIPEWDPIKVGCVGHDQSVGFSVIRPESLGDGFELLC